MSGHPFRNMTVRARAAAMLLIAALFLFSQLGTVTHRLHNEGQKAELACVFCASGTHLQSAASIPELAAIAFAPTPCADRFRHVCDVRIPVTSRLTRGPPPQANWI